MLGLLALAERVDEEAHRAIGAAQEAFVGDHFVLAGHDQVLGDDLRDADVEALRLHLFGEVRVVDLHAVDLDVAEHFVLAVLVAERDGGEVAEHVVADARRTWSWPGSRSRRCSRSRCCTWTCRAGSRPTGSTACARLRRGWRRSPRRWTPTTPCRCSSWRPRTRARRCSCAPAPRGRSMTTPPPS